jgi:hypothetical protein
MRRWKRKLTLSTIPRPLDARGRSRNALSRVLQRTESPMLADLTLPQKLWNKGVDILAGVIISAFSAGVVALIGLSAWRVKLWQELRADERRQRQHHRIAQELEQVSRSQELHALRERLSRERDGFVETATASKSCQDLAQSWDNFLAWMEKYDMQHLPGNQAMLTTHANWSNGLRGATRPNLRVNVDEMVGLIRNTELP